MADNAPALEVGFEIDAGSAFGTMDRLEAGMASTQASMVADAKRIEQATGNMVNLAGATAEVKAFGNASSKAMRDATRETARAEKSGEALVRALNRQAAEFGKTRSEIRNMNAELRAVEAESRGLTELAGRIRTVNAEMNRLEGASHGVDRSARRAGDGARIFAMQMPDVIQGLLTGQKPMQIFIQQGAQVYQAGQAAGIGMRAMGASVAALAAPFLPLIAILGVATAGFALFVREMNQGVSNAELTRGLGKTAEQAEVAEKQLKKLKEETISWGDTASALFTVVGNDIKNGFVAKMQGMSAETKAALNDMTSYGRMALAGLYASAVGTARYLAELSKPDVQVALLLKGNGAALLKRTYGAAYNEADAYLSKLGERVRTEAKKNARIRIGEKYGLPDKPDKPKVDGHAAQLAREAEATERQIANLYKLADAYGVSGAAALIAEARVKAESAAIKKRADVDAMVERQIRLSVAERVSASAKTTAGLRDQAAFQEEANRAVREGTILAADAAQIVRDRIEDLPLLAAMEAASQTKNATAYQRAADQLDAQRAARVRLTEAERDARFLTMKVAGDDRLADLREELRLVGATEVVRARSLATVRAQREVAAVGKGGTEAADYVRDAAAAAEAAIVLAQKQAALNNELSFTVNLFDAMDRSAVDAAGSMRQAFGQVGDSIGGVVSALTGYATTDARLRAERDAAIKASGNDERTIQRENRLYAVASGSAQMNALMGLTGAAKGLFKEHSRGYQAMVVAEKVLAGIQLARTAINVAAGASQMFASLGPLGFPAVAAMLGVMASLGFSGGRAGSMPAKANDGSGSVLGDSKAQSESIKRAIDMLREVDTGTNNFAREMAASLKSIDSQIGGVATAIVRAGDINASAGVTEGFKTDTTGKLLNGIVTGGGLFSKVPIVGSIISGVGSLLSSLFGSTTSVIGSGLYGKSQTLGSILSGGFDAQTYSDIEKKKKFLGITTGKSYSTQYGNADPALEGQFTLLLRSFANAIGAAAGPLGEATGAVEARLNGFVVNIGKIDLKGLNGEQIADKLTSIFGKAADEMADAAFPGISRFQKVGEGAFETLVRVASTVEAVTGSLDQLGLSARALGIDAKVGIASQFDSLSAMTSATDSYFKSFYTPAEQNAARMSQLSGVFVRLGVTMPATIGAFRSLVEAQDLTTAAGQSTYATLLQLAPAFADLKGAMDGAKSAADVIAEREGLQRRLLELEGNTTAIRALELSKLDASNRALQQQIYAIEDAKEAARAAEDLREAWASVGDGIAEEIKRIRGIDSAGGGGFAALLADFNRANAAARGGDIDAAKTLPGLSQALLKAAADQATSRQELARIQAQTAAALEATQAAIAGRSAAQTTAAILANSAAAANVNAPVSNTANSAATDRLDRLEQENSAMRDTMAAALAAIASNTGKTARTLDAVTAASGGEAITVATAA
ncbi:phage tail length tape measure family protein [Sphingomonas hankookensis]